jgi:hypothetical protein
MSNITVGRILLLDLVFLVNSALTLVVFKFVGLLDVMTTPALFSHFVGSYIILAYFMFWIYPQILEDRENNDDDK